MHIMILENTSVCVTSSLIFNLNFMCHYLVQNIDWSLSYANVYLAFGLLGSPAGSIIIPAEILTQLVERIETSWLESLTKRVERAASSLSSASCISFWTFDSDVVGPMRAVGRLHLHATQPPLGWVGQKSHS